MNITEVKNELQNILSGKNEVSYGEPIQAITRYLRESLSAGEKTQENESVKSEETKKLVEYINTHHPKHKSLFETVDILEISSKDLLKNKI